MNLITCENCCVVLDASKLQFPADIHSADDSIDDEKAAWNGDEFVAKVKCPVCQSDVLEEK